MPRTRITFDNDTGQKLVGILELPDTPPNAFAVFAHCFTCGKDLKAIVRISRGLAKRGIAVLRFDFTGIGESEGEFANTNFETNVSDLQSAIDWLADNHVAPELMIGHSLGGAAAMVVAGQTTDTTGMVNMRALVTLAAPSDTWHLADTLERLNPNLANSDQAEVVIGGRKWLATRQLTDSLRDRKLATEIANISLPHLILHSTTDETVAFHHAEKLMELSTGAKSLVQLEGSDHILAKRPEDIETVTNEIYSWWEQHH